MILLPTKRIRWLQLTRLPKHALLAAYRTGQILPVYLIPRSISGLQLKFDITSVDYGAYSTITTRLSISVHLKVFVFGLPRTLLEMLCDMIGSSETTYHSSESSLPATCRSTAPYPTSLEPTPATPPGYPVQMGCAIYYIALIEVRLYFLQGNSRDTRYMHWRS